ncbi:Twinfilin-1 [Mortierella sp. NVP85]|nr:Twinfilin-1 [Mortierella sp. NVP85]
MSLVDETTFDIEGSFEEDTTQLNKNLAREKMLYAATRATLVRELGDSHFATSIFGSDKNAFSWEGYKSHLASLTGAKPYSPRELELLEIKEAEKAMKSSTDKRSHAPGIAFPLTDRALAALQKLVVRPPAPKPSVAILREKFTSPASTPLPPSPETSRQNTIVGSQETKSSANVNVAEEEWDDDNSKKEVKEDAKEEPKEEESNVESKEAPKEEEANAEHKEETKEAPKEEETNVESKEEPKEEEASAESKEAPKEEEATVEHKEESKEEPKEVPKEEEPAVQEEEPQEEAPAERTVNFVTLAIDKESVDLIAEDKISAKELSKRIDGASPRFTFFAYEHTHKGTAHDSLVFIYTCPTGSKIKERMVYASGRAGVLQEAKERAGLNVDKKLETADVKELTEHHILEELYPPVEPSSSSVSGAKGFKKPVGPRGGVGARRVMF